MAGPSRSDVEARDAIVVFVCEHGSVKSLIAAQWFNRLASDRGLTVRGVSRGVAPDDAVPQAVARRLREDGFDVSAFRPTAVQKAELAEAQHVVAIGVDSPLLGDIEESRLETWDEVPPASTQYVASRDAMKVRIEALVAKLSKAPPPPDEE